MVKVAMHTNAPEDEKGERKRTQRKGDGRV